MKKTVMLFLLVASACFAGYEPYVLPFNSSSGSPTAANLDAAGNLKTAVASITVTIPVAPQGATSVLVEPWTIGPTAASWTMTASATDIALWGLGTGTMWLGINSGGATVGVGIPLVGSFTLSRDAAPGMVIWGIASVTVPTTRAEGRR